jgi:hypothetical protein
MKGDILYRGGHCTRTILAHKKEHIRRILSFFRSGFSYLAGYFGRVEDEIVDPAGPGVDPAVLKNFILIISSN